MFTDTKKWQKESGIIYFSVKSNGFTGADFINFFEKRGDYVNDWARKVILSPEFKVSNDTVTNIAIIDGKLIKSGLHTEKKFMKTNIEISCLIHKELSSDDMKAMGIDGIVGLHSPIPGFMSDNYKFQLFSGYSNDGRLILKETASPIESWDWKTGYGYIYSVAL